MYCWRLWQLIETNLWCACSTCYWGDKVNLQPYWLGRWSMSSNSASLGYMSLGQQFHPFNYCRVSNFPIQLYSHFIHVVEDPKILNDPSNFHSQYLCQIRIFLHLNMESMTGAIIKFQWQWLIWTSLDRMIIDSHSISSYHILAWNLFSPFPKKRHGKESFWILFYF
jgi:hypothetical protein